MNKIDISPIRNFLSSIEAYSICVLYGKQAAAYVSEGNDLDETDKPIIAKEIANHLWAVDISYGFGETCHKFDFSYRDSGNSVVEAINSALSGIESMYHDKGIKNPNGIRANDDLGCLIEEIVRRSCGVMVVAQDAILNCSERGSLS